PRPQEIVCATAQDDCATERRSTRLVDASRARITILFAKFFRLCFWSRMLPQSQDAFDWPQVTGSLARSYAWMGETDEAFRLLDHLLAIPNTLTVPVLWAPVSRALPGHGDSLVPRLGRKISSLVAQSGRRRA